MCKVFSDFMSQVISNKKEAYVGIEFLDIIDVVKQIAEQESLRGKVFAGETNGDVLHIAYHPKDNIKASEHERLNGINFVKTAFL